MSIFDPPVKTGAKLPDKEVTADVSKRLEIGITSDLERVGRRDFNKLFAKFAEFLKLGLQDGSVARNILRRGGAR